MDHFPPQKSARIKGIGYNLKGSWNIVKRKLNQKYGEHTDDDLE